MCVALVHTCVWQERNKYKDKAANGIMGISRTKAMELKSKKLELTQPKSPKLPTSVRYGHKSYGPNGTHTDMAMLNPNSIAVALNSPTHGLDSNHGGHDMADTVSLSSVASTPRGPTQVQPFSFHCSSARKNAYQPSDAKTPPLSERKWDYQRSLNAPSSVSSNRSSARERKPTIANSPRFAARAARAKPKSTEELEMEVRTAR